METKYTPGPWHVDAHKNVMAAGGLVAFPGIAAGFDQDANARLIAAAPELLEALREAEGFISQFEGDDDYTDELTKMLAAIRAAIAKSEGR